MSNVLRFLVGWLVPRRSERVIDAESPDERRIRMISETQDSINRGLAARPRHDWPRRHPVQEERRSSNRRWV